MRTIDLTFSNYEARRAASGCSCRFFASVIFLDGEWFGAKVYANQRHAERARHRQCKAYKHGFAPAVGPLVGVWIKNPGVRTYASPENAERAHGYLTAVAHVMDEHGCNDSARICRWLAVRMGEAKLEFGDLNSRNVGWYRGSWVALDFDDASVGSTPVTESVTGGVG